MGPADRAAAAPRAARSSRLRGSRGAGLRRSGSTGFGRLPRIRRRSAWGGRSAARLLRFLLRFLGSGLGRHRVHHRPDVQPCGLPEVASFVAVVSGNRNDQVVPVHNDLGSRHTEPVDPGADDLLGLRQRLAAGGRAVRGPRGQRDPGAALQVNTQFGGRLLVPGEENQQVDADQQDQKHRQVAGRMHRRRRRRHVPFISLKFRSYPRQSLRGAAGRVRHARGLPCSDPEPRSQLLGCVAFRDFRDFWAFCIEVAVGVVIGQDPVAYGQLHPGRDHTGGDLEVDGVLGDADDGGL